MDCDSLKQMVKDKDSITKGMNKIQLDAFTQLLELACDSHDDVCECGEYFYENI